MPIFMKVDVIYLLFLVVIGFVMISTTRLLLYGPNAQILGIQCDVIKKIVSSFLCHFACEFSCSQS
jgi:hypothetical protein